MTKDFIDFIEERLAVHEGGAGSISVGWDDATRDYLVCQHNLTSKRDEILGCSHSLGRAIELAISGKKFD